ncbi:MAG: hypothetical protein K2X36_06985, partial [Microbacteriaceae bacterium]|nr:hypothetical protein [Microbacteriaceae bacterium]
TGATVVYFRGTPAVETMGARVLAGTATGPETAQDRSDDLEVGWMEAFKCDPLGQLAATKLGVQANLQQFTKEEVAAAETALTPYIDKLQVVEGTLYFQEEEGHAPRRYIPPMLRNLYWRLVHGGPTAGHPGEQETLRAMSRVGWWPDLKKEVRRRVKTCQQCQLGKSGGRTLDYFPGVTFPTALVFGRLTLDIEGPFPTSQLGNKMVIVAQDDATRYRIMEAIPSKEAAVVARFLLFRVVVVFGAPLIVSTDQGAEFQNRLIERLNQLMGVTFESSAPYQPKYVARNERSHGMDLEVLRTVGATADDWDLMVPWIQFMTNARYNRMMGMTPHEAMFGRPPLGAVDAATVLLHCRNFQIDPAQYGAKTLQQWAEQLAHNAALRRDRETTTAVRRADKMAGRRGLENAIYQLGRPQKGDLVAVLATPSKEAHKSSKLARPWLGPCVVTHVSESGNTFTMVFESEPSIMLRRPAHDVKRYFREDPNSDVMGLNEERYLVREILDARGEHDDGTREYLVSWENWPSEFDSWTRAEDILDKELREKADRDFPQKSELAIASEPMPKESAHGSEWVRELTPKMIAKVLGVRSTRRGLMIRIMLHGEKAERQVQVRHLPKVVSEMPAVQAALNKA